MKKLLMALAILITFAISASAQVGSPITVYAGGAFSMPVSDGWKNTFKNGYHGMVGLGYKLAPNFQVIGKVEYHSFALDFDNSTIGTALAGFSGGTNKVLMYGVDGRFSLGIPAAPIKPYLLGGIGMANIKQSELTGPNTLITSIMNQVITQDQNKLYYSFGAGIDLASIPAFNIFVQARYISIATEGQSSSFIPITLGLRFM